MQFLAPHHSHSPSSHSHAALLHLIHSPLWWLALALAAASFGLVPRSASGQFGGISVDTEGVLRRDVSRKESAALARTRMETFAQENLPADLTPFTELRKVSLRGIEEQLAGEASAKLPADIRYLYGLQRIDYIFLDPDRRDVILAGPAEGYAPDVEGRMVGLTTGRPPLHLDDLLVVLRSAGGREMIGCSIDPDQGRLARMQEWIRTHSNSVSRSAALSRYQTMADLLGLQNVSITGVPEDSRFAQVLVEADFRMKLIALGKETPGVKGLRSQLSLLVPGGNSMQRWWFVPKYNPIEADEEALSFHLSGPRAQVVAQQEWVDASGRRRDAGSTLVSTEKFAQLFSEHMDELAEKSPAFAELQNVFDLAILAALLRREGAAERVGWSMTGLLDAARTPTEVVPVPRHVESRATTTNRANLVLGLIGGVSLDAESIVQQPFRRQGSATLATTRAGAVPPNRDSSPSPWWN